MARTLTATIWREDDGFVALCYELDIASQGDSIKETRSNLKEAVDLFFEQRIPTRSGSGSSRKKLSYNAMIVYLSLRKVD